MVFVGVWVVSLGIVLCVMSNLGVSPISSVPYVLSLATPLTLGNWTMLFHFANTLFQYILEKKWWNPKVFFQIPLAFVFGWVIDLIKSWLTFSANHIVVQILCLIGSIFFTALGMVFIINRNLVQNPPDGSVKDLSEKTGMEMGKVKILNECTMTVVSMILSLLLLGKLKSFGVATIASALLVGRTLSVLRKIVVF